MNRIFLVLIFGVWIVVLNLSSASYAETWKFTSLAWEPYSGSDLKGQGKSIELLRTLLSAEGIEIEVEFYPWKRAQRQAKKPGYVGYFPAWPEEVSEGFVASPAIDWSEVGVLKRKNYQLNYSSLTLLFKKHKVGTVSTYVYPESISDAMNQFPKHSLSAPHEEALLKMLSTSRIDAAITDPTVMMFLAKKYALTNIEPIYPTLMKKKLVVAFNHNPENLKKLNILKRIIDQHASQTSR